MKSKESKHKNIRIPKQKRSIERKNLIKNTALLLFSEKDYANVSTNEIAKSFSEKRRRAVFFMSFFLSILLFCFGILVFFCFDSLLFITSPIRNSGY